ncbi:EAL domain-containing protein [Pantoea agglomerans]|uniref:EAL domain-containing protein n=1 Tax=Enterobacter agglomerans TaxID=549 RepID=UPI0013B75252|nr:EAL domain-containing protein [Pantoea agglomerans]NEG59928.1 EAL domain-containing protein [Pantoea agglomerans]NEH00922.1 EAL domain-containing protein [Pantoea agglomerans]NEH05097.1 EAL domain-containing protein [Pantoea agglomerans]NEH16043.1 EAL domain-containing protein [Pantoea agglomerans]
MVGVEVLARWVKPSGEVIPPLDCIPLAEKSDLIIPLTRHIMAQAAKELPLLTSNIRDAWHIGINFTQAHVLQPGFISECLDFIMTFAPNSISLVIELTERDLFTSNDLLKKS